MTGRWSVLDTIVASAYRDDNHICEMLVYAYNFVSCYNEMDESRFDLFILSVIIGIR